MLNLIVFKSKLLKRYVVLKYHSFFGITDQNWDLTVFENYINIKTWLNYKLVIGWATRCVKDKDRLESEEAYERSSDPLVHQGRKLAKEVKAHFKDKCKKHNMKVLIHLPPMDMVAGRSIMSNIGSGLSFVGVEVMFLEWNERIAEKLEIFKPGYFITSDHWLFLERIDWSVVAAYRENNPLKIGLTASIEEYGNTPTKDRIAWAKKNNIDFYYTYRPAEYIASRREYDVFFENGYKIFNLEFAANPLIHYPVPNVKKDLDFVFLGSVNQEKWPRYFKFFPNIFHEFSGVLAGPGWDISRNFKFRPEMDRYIYARGACGLNLSIDFQINWKSELNERTYMLAACGIPQLIDNPKILSKKFTDGCFFVADNPRQYEELFRLILSDPQEAQKRALQAQKEVFEKHTIFHRAESFIKDLITL